MEKKEISPMFFIGALAFVVLVVGVFFYRQATINPPTPRPDPKYFGGGAPGGAAPAVPGAPVR